MLFRSEFGLCADPNINHFLLPKGSQILKMLFNWSVIVMGGLLNLDSECILLYFNMNGMKSAICPKSFLLSLKLLRNGFTACQWHNNRVIL